MIEKISVPIRNQVIIPIKSKPTITTQQLANYFESALSKWPPYIPNSLNIKSFGYANFYIMRGFNLVAATVCIRVRNFPNTFLLMES